MYIPDPVASIFPPAISAPHFISVLLPLRLGHPPSDKRKEEGSQSREQEIHHPLPQLLIHQREELRNKERRNPVRRQGPALGRANGFWPDELARENEWDGPETETEAGDKTEYGDGGEDRDRLSDADGEQDRGRAHAGDGAKEAHLAAENVGERGAAERDNDVEDGDEDIEQGGVRFQEVGEEADAVHHYAVDTCTTSR